MRFPHRVLRFPNKVFFDKVEQNVDFERSAISFNLRKTLKWVGGSLERWAFYSFSQKHRYSHIFECLLPKYTYDNVLLLALARNLWVFYYCIIYVYNYIMKIFIFNWLHYKIKLFLVGLVVGKCLEIFGIDDMRFFFLKIS